MMTTRKEFCPPARATNGQYLRVVIKYLNDNPAQLNRQFADLVWTALFNAWPCASESPELKCTVNFNQRLMRVQLH